MKQSGNRVGYELKATIKEFFYLI